MTLENLLRIGKLKAHAAKRVELDRLMSSAGLALADAGNEGISSVSRFAIPYRAIIQALTKTAGISPARVRVLEALRMARNRLEYSGDPVSDAVAEEAVQEATALLAEVRSWIEKR